MYLILTEANCESYLEKKLHPQAQKAFQNCKILFGSRSTAGYQMNSLKKELNTAIGHGSGFATDIGSRYGVLFENARALLCHKDAVMEVLRSATSNRYAQDLRDILLESWPEIQLQAIIIVLFWTCVLSLLS